MTNQPMCEVSYSLALPVHSHTIVAKDTKTSSLTLWNAEDWSGYTLISLKPKWIFLLFCTAFLSVLHIVKQLHIR